MLLHQMSTNALVGAVQADTLRDLEVLSTQSVLEGKTKVLGEAGSYRQLCDRNPFPDLRLLSFLGSQPCTISPFLALLHGLITFF